MSKVKNISTEFQKGLGKLGFDRNDDSLFLTNEKRQLPDPQIEFHIEKAGEFGASAVYLRKQLNGSYKPQTYLFDFTDRGFAKENEIQLTEIQKKIWSSGEAPLACIFYNTEIKILDCTTHIKSDYTPVHLVNHLDIIGKTHHLYNEQFAIKIKSGVFWEEEELKNKFKFQNSSYDVLIKWIQKITAVLSSKHNQINKRIINKIIIQSILIKYLEERKDENGKGLFKQKYFQQFANATNFADVLRSKGKFIKLLEKLHEDFNGNLFVWDNSEKIIIEEIDLDVLADALEGKSNPDGQFVFEFIKYYEFNYVPVELISRLYEEFLGENKQEEGLFYTPSHLAKLLIDEAMPLKDYAKIDLNEYKILDPACGSGIFLVIAFKRLVQWWRLQNGINTPREKKHLKQLLKCVYGVDKEQQATQLAAFSLCLALCDELNPLQIISNLRFDDLTQSNIVYSDYFIDELGEPIETETRKIFKEQNNNYRRLDNLKFNLIIGNPPFVRGGTSEYKKNNWILNDKKVQIPNGQIALKFLSNSYSCLKPDGLQCLIVKSTNLLYNSSSNNYKNFLFSKTNVIQILDFTALSEGKSLWDNGARVGSAAIFIKNQPINILKNILHVTFRRTKATKERIVFEIDDYDLHFVNRDTAINNKFIWKINLLGGGRIKALIDKFNKVETFEQYLLNNNCVAGEGYIIGSKGKLKPKHILEIPTLPTEAIDENGIDYSKLKPIDKSLKFVKVSDGLIFKAPNIIIWENMGKEKLPVFFNKQSFSFKDKIIGVASNEGDTKLLKTIVKSFDDFAVFYKFHIYVTSSQVLINRNTAVLKIDFMKLPFITNNINLSEFDNKLINNVNLFMRDFLIQGENSKAVKPIISDEMESIISNFGNEFSAILNLIYEDKKNRFRLSDVVILNNSFIATIFKYDSNSKEPIFHSDNSKLNLKELTDNEISKQLTVNRIIKLYPQKDTIVFIKPNQYRYWLSLAAYRDADKCFSDLSKLKS